MKKWLSQFLISLLCLLSLVAAQTLTNFTIDDSDSRIVYVGIWEPPARHTSALDYGGSHTVSSDPGGSATFSFTGVAVYYIAPKWPYAVDSYVSLDGGAPQLVDMTGPIQAAPTGEETIPADVLWSATGLINGNHRVVVTRGPSNYSVVDGFTYTIQSDTTSQSISTILSTSTNLPDPSTSGSGSLSSSTSAPETAQTNSNIIIAVTIPVVVVLLILLILLAIFIMRRRKRKSAKDAPSAPLGPSAGGGAYIIPSNNSTNTPMSYSDLTGSTSIGSLVAQQQMAHANVQQYGQDVPRFYPLSNPGPAVPPVDVAAEGSITGAYNATPFDYKAMYQPRHQPTPGYANIGGSNQPPPVESEKARFEGANPQQESNGQSSSGPHPYEGTSRPPSYWERSRASSPQHHSRVGSPPIRGEELKPFW